MIPPAVMRGLRLEYGSWKIICIRRRLLRRSPAESVAMSTPSNRIVPDVGA